MFSRTKKAFTIVELVIVIAVIAILAAVLIPTFAAVIKNAEQSTAMQACKSAYSEYLSQHGKGKVENMKNKVCYYNANPDGDSTTDYSFTCDPSTGQFNGTPDDEPKTWPTTSGSYAEYANRKVRITK